MSEDLLKKLNITNCRNLGYHSRANGRSFYRLKCKCGQIEDVYAWRGVKKCSGCGKILSVGLSHEDKSIPITESDLGIRREKKLRVLADCSGCSEMIHYHFGMGWSHQGDKPFDHPALPKPETIHEEEIIE